MWWDLLFAGLGFGTNAIASGMADNKTKPNLKPNLKLEEEILSVLLHGEMSGRQIMEAIKQEFMYQPDYDPVYLALQDLEKKGLVTSRWSEVRGTALQRYYRRTGKGV